MKNLKLLFHLMAISWIFIQCSSNSEITPQLTAEQIKKLIGTTWQLSSNSGTTVVVTNGKTTSGTSDGLSNNAAKVFFNDAVIIAFFRKDNTTYSSGYNISGNEIYISNGVGKGYFLLTLDGNTMTWTLDKERLTKTGNDLGVTNFTVQSADIKLVYKKI